MGVRHGPTPVGSPPKFGREEELDLDNNAKLMAQFKAMREKLKALTKENTELRLNESAVQQALEARYKHQVSGLQEKDAQNTAALNFLRREM